jgi:hypothetical protein
MGSTLALWAEVLGYAHRNGLDADELVAALEGGWSDSAVRHNFVPHMLSGRFQSRSIRPLLDDMDIVSDVARSSGAPIPITSTAIGAMRQQIDLGYEMMGLAGLAHLYLATPRPAGAADANAAAPRPAGAADANAAAPRPFGAADANAAAPRREPAKSAEPANSGPSTSGALVGASRGDPDGDDS